VTSGWDNSFVMVGSLHNGWLRARRIIQLCTVLMGIWIYCVCGEKKYIY
jgi:hypothetical protein